MNIRIIFATGNTNKVREVEEIIRDAALPELHVESIQTMKEAGVAASPEENGRTFEENALIKARSVAALVEQAAADGPSDNSASCPLVVMSDDSGLCIDALDGAPGIYSARFMGHDTSYTLKMNAILEQMKDVPKEKRGAQFVAAVAAVFPDIPENREIRQRLRQHTVSDREQTFDGSNMPGERTEPDALTVRGVMEGRIAREIRGRNGFGYDPFFYLPELGKTSAELTESEKNALSHRGKAVRGMLRRLADL